MGNFNLCRLEYLKLFGVETLDIYLIVFKATVYIGVISVRNQGIGQYFLDKNNVLFRYYCKRAINKRHSSFIKIKVALIW